MGDAPARRAVFVATLFAMTGALRAITYLAPGIPMGFYEHLSEALARALDRPVRLTSDPRTSGPMHGDHDPFAADEADLGFVCAPSYLYLAARQEPSVALLPAAPVFRDARNGGRPVYFSDVIVRADSPARGLEDLRDARFGFNDRCSLSGFYSLRQELRSRGLEDGFFASEHCTGSHHGSIEAVRAGEVDVAAIDSNVLVLEGRRDHGVGEDVRVLESWGPFPIQPIVVSTRLSGEEHARLTRALLRLTADPEAEGILGWIGFERFKPVGPEHYDEERRALEELGSLPCADS